MDDYYSALLVAVSKGRTKQDKTLVSFVPFMGIAQRQIRNAFESFMEAHSYQGWVLLRPALEAALIMGKWIDDKRYGEIWKNREEDWQSYQREYSGGKLESRSLPNSADIRAVLSRINDDFMHLNPVYYFRHSRLDATSIDTFLFSISYFDDTVEQDFHIYAFMHLCLVVARSITAMLQKHIVQPIGIDVDVKGFRKAYSKTIHQLTHDHPDGVPVLKELGIWTLT